MKQGIFRMPYRTYTFWQYCLLIIILGAAWPIGESLLTRKKETKRYIIGRVILQTVFISSAGIMYLFVENPHPIALLATASVLSCIGMESARKLGIFYATEKLKHLFPHDRNSKGSDTGEDDER